MDTGIRVCIEGVAAASSKRRRLDKWWQREAPMQLWQPVPFEILS
jgi:hypothetical protein